MNEELTQQHQWLQRLIGEWTCESEMCPEPGKPAEKMTWTERVRSIEGMWVLAEAQGSMPDGKPTTTLMLIGFDPKKNHYVGSWAGSMMSHLWVYEGDVDASGNTLTLNTEGPSFKAPNQMAKYRDNIQFTSENERLLISQMQEEDGNWVEVVRVKYQKVK